MNADSSNLAQSVEYDPAELLALYHIGEGDLQAIREYGKIILPRMDELVSAFYDWLKQLPEFPLFFSTAEKLNAVQRLQVSYWQAFFHAQIDHAYIEKRREIGETHARIGLGLSPYFAAMNTMLRLITENLYDDSLTERQYVASARAIAKLIHLDTGVVVETYSRRTNRIIAEQHESMMEMSTPVTEVWRDVLMLPIVGFVDSKRAQDIMSAVLTKIAETHARSLIMDISGVAVVDTAVANHLIKITKATKLMGCVCTISGLSPAIAQTMVELGIDVGDIRTTATLRGAVQAVFAENRVTISEAVE